MTMFKMEFPLELINEYVLAKQHLKNGYKSNNIEELSEDILGLRASNPMTPCLSILARLDDMEKVFKVNTKNFVKIKAMRNNFFVFSKEFSSLINDVYIKRKSKNSDSKQKLVLSYLYAYGPVSIEDIILWTGFSKIEVKNIFDHIKDNLMAMAIKDIPNNYYMLMNDYKQMLNFLPEKFLGVIFLPANDNYVTAYQYCERLLLNNKDFDRIFYRGRNSFPVILINGKIFGTWKIVDKHVEKELFYKPDLQFEKLLEQEKAKIELFLSSKKICSLCE